MKPAVLVGLCVPSAISLSAEAFSILTLFSSSSDDVLPWAGASFFPSPPPPSRDSAFFLSFFPSAQPMASSFAFSSRSFAISSLAYALGLSPSSLALSFAAFTTRPCFATSSANSTESLVVDAVVVDAPRCPTLKNPRLNAVRRGAGALHAAGVQHRSDGPLLASATLKCPAAGVRMPAATPVVDPLRCLVSLATPPSLMVFLLLLPAVLTPAPPRR